MLGSSDHDMSYFIENSLVANTTTCRTTHGDMSDQEWELIAPLVVPYSGNGRRAVLWSMIAVTS